MADINQVITLGIGTPADIEHFILLGLNGAIHADAPDCRVYDVPAETRIFEIAVEARTYEVDCT